MCFVWVKHSHQLQLHFKINFGKTIFHACIPHFVYMASLFKHDETPPNNILIHWLKLTTNVCGYTTAGVSLIWSSSHVCFLITSRSSGSPVSDNFWWDVRGSISHVKGRLGQCTWIWHAGIRPWDWLQTRYYSSSRSQLSFLILMCLSKNEWIHK